MIIKKEATINGISLTYYELGKGKTIFFLHGGRLAHRLHKSMPNSTIQIVDENHDWPIYKSKEFSEIILKKLLPYR